MDLFEAFFRDIREAADLFLNRPDGRRLATIVHHNDADGIAAAAALSRAFDLLSLKFRRIAVEKIHEPVVQKIHAATGDILYADLGGQSSGLIGRHAAQDQLVIILDHHLPGEAEPAHVIHINPERRGISGDTDASAASVCGLFAAELLRQARPDICRQESLPMLMGVIGASGDGQMRAGSFSGINRMLLDATLGQKEVIPTPAGYVLPRFENRTLPQVVEMLDLLGSVGFYSGSAQAGVEFLLGRDSKEAATTAGRLRDLKHQLFNMEIRGIHRQGLARAEHFEWVDVKDRFAPMGVKAIGLFLMHLIKEGLAAPDKYLIGFQHLPDEMPGIGHCRGGLDQDFVPDAPRDAGEG